MNSNEKKSIIYYLFNPAIVVLLIFYFINLYIGYYVYIQYNFFKSVSYYIYLIIPIVILFGYLIKYSLRKLDIKNDIDLLKLLTYSIFILGIVFAFNSFYSLFLSVILLFIALFIYIVNNSILAHDILLTISLAGLGGYFSASFSYISFFILIVIILFFEIYFTNKKSLKPRFSSNNKVKPLNAYIITKYNTSKLLSSLSIFRVDSDSLILGVTEVFISIILLILSLVFLDIPIFSSIAFLALSLYLSYLYKITRAKRKPIRTMYLIILIYLVLIIFRQLFL